MKSLSLIIYSSFFLLCGAPLKTYQLESSNAAVTFEINNMGIAVEGSLSKPTGTVIFAPDDLANSSVNALIKVSTIETGIDLRDEELQGEDYFDTAKHPDIRFRSTSISKLGEAFQAKGTLSIKGIRKEVVIPFKVQNDIFEGNFQLDRLDYGVGESSWILSDEVRVSFTLPVSEVP